MEHKRHRERVARRAAKQAGRIAHHQLVAVGLSYGVIRSWLRTGYLIRVLPRVYAVGHAAPSYAASLWETVLYAGTGAALSHGTAAHWRGLINYPPRQIHVSTPHQIPSLPSIVVHGRRQPFERFLHDGIPTTSIAQTMVDLADTHEHNVVRHALAQLDFDDDLHIPSLIDITGHGKSGSAKLKRAIAAHQPRLALVNGKLEFDWLVWLEERGIEPLPEFRHIVWGYRVDCHWPAHGLIVELDGIDNHSSPAQMKFDRQKDLTLRNHHLIVYRYDWDLVHEQPDAIESEIRRTLTEREGWNLLHPRTG